MQVRFHFRNTHVQKAYSILTQASKCIESQHMHTHNTIQCGWYNCVFLSISKSVSIQVIFSILLENVKNKSPLQSASRMATKWPYHFHLSDIQVKRKRERERLKWNPKIGHNAKWNREGFSSSFETLTFLDREHDHINRLPRRVTLDFTFFYFGLSFMCTRDEVKIRSFTIKKK